MPSKKKRRASERSAKKDAERAKKDTEDKKIEHFKTRMKSLWDNDGIHGGMDCCVCYEKTFYAPGKTFEEQHVIEQRRADAGIPFGPYGACKCYGVMCRELHIVCLQCFFRISDFPDDPNGLARWKCPVCKDWCCARPPTAVSEEGGVRKDSKGYFYTKQGEKVYLN